jgi:hypothetical protein
MRTAYGVAGILLAIGVAGTVFWSWGTTVRSPPSGDYVERTARLAKPIYATLPHVSIPSSIDEAVSIIELAPVRGLDRVGKERWRELVHTAAEFVVRRFGRDDPAAYREWRLASGMKWRSREFLQQHWTIEEQYLKYAGKPLEPGVPLPEAFDLLWRGKAETHGGFNRPVGMAGSTEGLSIVFGTMTPGNPVREHLTGRLSEELWHGGISGTHCAWLVPARPYRERIDAGETVEYASLGVIMEHADGSRRPLIMTFFWEPLTARWELQILNTNNEPSAKRVAFDY